MTLRALRSEDYDQIIRVLDAWWGGRRMSDMLPRLFFTHFGDTGLLDADDDGRVNGFLAGFVSQAYPDEAYIHFVGVNPQGRGAGVGRGLYERFFEIARARGCTIVRCVTSPANTKSIAFHQRMGFVAAPSDALNPDGVPYAPDYDGPGEHRVLLNKQLLAT
jgi:ribosomal protein S18 acetylase RimI-like enzyme